MESEEQFSIQECSQCDGPCMAINYVGDIGIHSAICLNCYLKLGTEQKLVGPLDTCIPEELSTDTAHDIQNRIDGVMDRIRDIKADSKLWDERHAKKKDKTSLYRLTLVERTLEEIRDDIPCKCGQEYVQIEPPRRRRRRR